MKKAKKLKNDHVIIVPNPLLNMPTGRSRNPRTTITKSTALSQLVRWDADSFIRPRVTDFARSGQSEGEREAALLLVSFFPADERLVAVLAGVLQ